LAEYEDTTAGLIEVNVANKIRKAFQQGDLETLFYLLEGVFASVPYQIFRTEEAYFHSLAHIVLQLSGIVIFSEVPTNKGRMDMVLSSATTIYIFEFKVKGTATDALNQIEAMGYSERFKSEGKKIRQIGVVFDTEKKSIKEWTEM
jgi:hypothetical protein